MKNLYLILIAVVSISCTENSTETKVTNSLVNTEKSLTEKKPIQEKDKLVGTWYVKELLVNGKPDPENFPVNNDELTLNKDKSVISIDKTFNIESTGTWERLSDEQFVIVTEDENVVFQILKLTDAELETKMVTDEIDMIIKYNKEK